jgi:hypothetical protein
MASVALSRRVEKVVSYPPLSDLGDLQRREFHEALLDAGSFEDLPGKWQAAILKAESRAEAARRVTSAREPGVRMPAWPGSRVFSTTVNVTTPRPQSAPRASSRF